MPYFARSMKMQQVCSVRQLYRALRITCHHDAGIAMKLSMYTPYIYSSCRKGPCQIIHRVALVLFTSKYFLHLACGLIGNLTKAIAFGRALTESSSQNMLFAVRISSEPARYIFQKSFSFCLRQTLTGRATALLR